MSATSIGRGVLPLVALVAGCVAALVSDVAHVRREPAWETSAATAASTRSQPASGTRDESSPALAAAEAHAAAVGAEPAGSLGSPATDQSVPAFDIARIERTGEAVIAGRAVPGATVDLLRNGERLGGAVADPSGQFVMILPRLPPGNYELTLSARSPDGTLATSKQGMLVALDEVESSSGVAPSRADAPSNVADTATIKSLSQDIRSAQARLLSQPPLQAAKRETKISQPPHELAAVSRSDGASASPGGAPMTSTRVVSRGDSLWRISRVTYGVGERYVAVYRANRDKIRNPNLIYPDQIIVLPKKAR
jgi:nucleoid-associated protein YgaU